MHDIEFAYVKCMPVGGQPLYKQSEYNYIAMVTFKIGKRYYDALTAKGCFCKLGEFGEENTTEYLLKQLKFRWKVGDEELSLPDKPESDDGRFLMDKERPWQLSIKDPKKENMEIEVSVDLPRGKNDPIIYDGMVPFDIVGNIRKYNNEIVKINVALNEKATKGDIKKLNTALGDKATKGDIKNLNKKIETVDKKVDGQKPSKIRHP